MKPVMQTQFFDTKLSVNSPEARGNCFTACIASLLELPIEEVPDFVSIDCAGGENWYDHTIRFLAERGYQIKMQSNQYKSDDYYIQSGISPRGPDCNGEDVYHAVIYKDGKLAHDPHPDNTGILTENQIYVVEKIENDGNSTAEES